MISSVKKTIVACMIFSLPASFALAHTSLASTSPKSGSMLEQSPPVIEITFRDPARLTLVVVLEAGKPDRKLEFEPSGSATVFKLQDPKLGPGHNEIRWKALSKDGHVIGGSITLVIKPAKVAN